MTDPTHGPAAALPANPHPALSYADAVIYSGLSEQHLRRCITDGRLRHIRYGKKVRIPLDALNTYLRDGDPQDGNA
ncbi:MAG: excisionase family DNA-binding protein [Nocardioides sp.]